MRYLDFRSDTVTKPTDEMREAMSLAEVGDDVFGEDPTIKELEARTAEILGMDAGLFVPSGTMANQAAIWVHAERAQVLCEHNSHIPLYEGGAASLISGTHVRTVVGTNGVFGKADILEHVYPDDPHFAETKLVAIENTHNHSGGQVWTPRQIKDVVDTSHALGANVHVDGARIWNAAVAQRKKPHQLLKNVDSVMVCLSKGLGAPVGSVLCGDEAFIHKAHRVRKALGGGMRQAGVLAAAGLLALEHIPKLRTDHANAARLAEGLAKIPKLSLAAEVRTNMVLVDVSKTKMGAEDFCALAHDAGIGCLPIDMSPRVRFVTHRDVDQEDVDLLIERMRTLL